MQIHPFWRNYPQLQDQLTDVLHTIDSQVLIKDRKIRNIVKDLLHSGGKMLRPAYALLCSYIGSEYDRDRAVSIAASMECLHMATLVHDDVIDEAETRRGIETVHVKKGNKFAIYTGDYLFCLSFTILSRHAKFLTESNFERKGIEKILTGELEQLNSRYAEPVSVKDYLSRISGKTARLFAISWYSGACGSRAKPKYAKIAWNTGHYVGMAFQIIDDILDYKSDDRILGKPAMNDVKQGIYTLPFIYAYREQPEKFKPYIAKKNALSDEDLEMISRLIKKYRGIEKAKALAGKYTEKGVSSIKRLPGC